jgi:CHAD domain-containing protein
MRTIAQRCKADLNCHIRSAARGDADSLHSIRIALTRLRTAIRFFAPVVDKRDWEDLQEEARWLSRRAGKARDLDVALARHKGATHRTLKRWRAQRERRYDGLRAALRSARYRHLSQELARKCSSARRGRQSSSATRRLEAFSVSRLERWRRKLARDCDKLRRMSEHRRHRLRMRAKRYKYALDWSQAVLKGGRTALRKQIEQAQIIQNTLGKLNDGATHRAQARSLRLTPLPRMARLDRSSSRRKLLQATRDALRKLERLRLS